MKNEFNFSNDELNHFIKYASGKGVKFVEKDYDKDKTYIAARLKAQLARNYWKNEGWYSVLLKIDKQVEKATQLFGEAKDLANLK